MRIYFIFKVLIFFSLKKIYLRPIQCILSIFSLGNKENLAAFWDIMKNLRIFKSLTRFLGYFKKPFSEPWSTRP